MRYSRTQFVLKTSTSVEKNEIYRQINNENNSFLVNVHAQKKGDRPDRALRLITDNCTTLNIIPRHYCTAQGQGLVLWVSSIGYQTLLEEPSVEATLGQALCRMQQQVFL